MRAIALAFTLTAASISQASPLKFSMGLSEGVVFAEDGPHFKAPALSLGIQVNLHLIDLLDLSAEVGGSTSIVAFEPYPKFFFGPSYHINDRWYTLVALQYGFIPAYSGASHHQFTIVEIVGYTLTPSWGVSFVGGEGVMLDGGWSLTGGVKLSYAP